jgi:predicted small secreted protein
MTKFKLVFLSALLLALTACNPTMNDAKKAGDVVQKVGQSLSESAPLATEKSGNMKLFRFFQEMAIDD